MSIELLESEDPRAALCPGGQRLLRVAGGRDQVRRVGVSLWKWEDVLVTSRWAVNDRMLSASMAEQAEATEPWTDRCP